MTGSTTEVQRPVSSFRSKIFAGVGTEYPAVVGRYILYAAHGCPWCGRCLAVLALKGLRHAVQVVYVEPKMEKLNLPSSTKNKDDGYEDMGWVLAEGADPVFGARTMRELYDKAAPGDKEVASVPVLLDTYTQRIVNNESSDMMRFLNSEFNAFATHPEVDLVPTEFVDDILKMNHSIDDSINFGVYKCGFAKTQQAYDHALDGLFRRLDELELLLGTQRFLIAGSTMPTESDVRLFVTLIRFDAVYHTHFKCNVYAIRERSNLHGWLRDMWQWDHGVLQSTIDMGKIKASYYAMPWVNPSGIVARGADVLTLLNMPPNRAKLTPPPSAVPSAVPSSRASAHSNETSPQKFSTASRADARRRQQHLTSG